MLPAFGLLAALLALPVAAEPQSFSQHVELLTRGTLTDAAGRTWDVTFIPGTRRVNRIFREGWTEAGSETLELVGGELWLEDVPDAVVDGAEFSRDVVVEHFAEGLVEDVENAARRNAELRSGDFGRGFIVVWNWAKAATMMTCRTLWLPVGSSLGITYSVAAPVAYVAWRPVKATGHVVFQGVLGPTFGHLWNGTAWTATFFNAVPERPTRWVRRVRTRGPVRFDAAALADFARGTAEEHARAERDAVLDAALRELDAEIATLIERRQVLYERKGDSAATALHSRAARAKQRVLDDALSGVAIEWTPDARASLDDAILDAIIAEQLAGLGADASPESVAEVRERVKRELDSLPGR